MKRSLVFKISEKEFRELTAKPCHYCGLAPQVRSIRRRGRMRVSTEAFHVVDRVDRVDPEFGYTSDNVVSCCSRCNKMKGTLSLDEFLEAVALIGRYQLSLKKRRLP